MSQTTFGSPTPAGHEQALHNVENTDAGLHFVDVGCDAEGHTMFVTNGFDGDPDNFVLRDGVVGQLRTFKWANYDNPGFVRSLETYMTAGTEGSYNDLQDTLLRIEMGDEAHTELLARQREVAQPAWVEAFDTEDEPSTFRLAFHGIAQAITQPFQRRRGKHVKPRKQAVSSSSDMAPIPFDSAVFLDAETLAEGPMRDTWQAMRLAVQDVRARTGGLIGISHAALPSDLLSAQLDKSRASEAVTMPAPTSEEGGEALVSGRPANFWLPRNDAPPQPESATRLAATVETADQVPALEECGIIRRHGLGTALGITAVAAGAALGVVAYQGVETIRRTGNIFDFALNTRPAWAAVAASTAFLSAVAVALQSRRNNGRRAARRQPTHAELLQLDTMFTGRPAAASRAYAE